MHAPEGVVYCSKQAKESFTVFYTTSDGRQLSWERHFMDAQLMPLDLVARRAGDLINYDLWEKCGDQMRRR